MAPASMVLALLWLGANGAQCSESVTASSNYATAYPAESAADGDRRTRWASGHFTGRPEWLQVDFGTSLALNELTLHWEVAAAVEYQIQISDDARQWRTLAAVTDGKEGRQSFSNLNGRGRFLRVLCLKPGPVGIFSLWEIEFPQPEVQRALAEARRRENAEAIGRLNRALAEFHVEDVVFAVRQPGRDGHWYANFGYYCDGPHRPVYGAAGKLCRLHLSTGSVTNLIDDPRGAVRDPVVHYDASKILFSYRKGEGDRFHLYEIGIDGGNLRQLTDGDCDDIEPCYLPDDRIVFVSSRCNRWVNCWTTQVATLHRCDADGKNIRAISANVEHDNTPWPLADGRVLYQRWEYIDRSQVDYHHLWTANPDGTGQMVYYGNQHPGTVMIDAKPIPGSNKVIAVFSPGHGQREHEGSLAVLDVRSGPDAAAAVRTIASGGNYRDPWALSEDLFLAAQAGRLVLLDGVGKTTEVYRLSPEDAARGAECHEPRPIVRRPREAIIPDRSQPGRDTATVVLMDVYNGRSMAGVRRGEIKKLLVLESLPKPINFTGGMDPITYGGSFTLERVLGAVPVAADGSAVMELPALRSLFFIALDENDLAVKRMQSFVNLQPGETTGCVGCHEQRTHTASLPSAVWAARHKPRPPEPIADCPDVLDFPRDIQPILDRLCVDCHGYDKTARGGPYAGRVALAGDRGPMFSHAYFTLTVRRLFSDNRNQAKSNYPPRALGSAASRILTMLDGSHHGVRADERQKKVLRLWIDVGAPYPGTYAALGNGAIGGYRFNAQVETDERWPTTIAGAAVIERRCAACHQGTRVLPKSLSDERDISFWRFDLDDPRLPLSRHIVFNLSRPEKSLMLLAPLSADAGGLGLCRDGDKPAPVFASTANPDYKALLAMATAGRDRLEAIKRFDMPGFRPLPEYLREMKRYGVLPAEPDAAALDPYQLDRRYWKSLWYRPH